jgi:hypothetical protein
MKPRITKAIVAASLLLAGTIFVFWIFSYRYPCYLQVKTTKPFEPVGTPVKEAVLERRIKAQGLAGLYIFHYAATAVSEGRWYFYLGEDGEIETDPGEPPWIRYGKDRDSVEMLLNDGNPGLSLLPDAFPSSYRQHAGFSYLQLKLDTSIEMRCVGIPLWSAFGAAIIPPSMYGAKRFIARRAKLKGLCPHCGFDLRFSPARCPECGAGRQLT